MFQEEANKLVGRCCCKLDMWMLFQEFFRPFLGDRSEIIAHRWLSHEKFMFLGLCNPPHQIFGQNDLWPCDTTEEPHLAICLKWNFRLGFLFLFDSLAFFQMCVFTIESKLRKSWKGTNQSFCDTHSATPDIQTTASDNMSPFPGEKLASPKLTWVCWRFNRFDLALRIRTLIEKKAFRYLRHNPNPISGAAVSQFAFVLVVLHKTLARRVMIYDGDVALLIRVENCNINLHECLILPQWAGISSVQSHFNCYRLSHILEYETEKLMKVKTKL